MAGVVYSLSSRVLLFSLLPPPIITHGTRFSPAISLHNTHTSNSPIVLSLSLSLSCITLVHTVERPTKKKQLLPSPPFTGQKRGIDQVEQQEQQQDQENVGGGSWRMLEVFKSGERVSLALRGCLHRIA